METPSINVETVFSVGPVNISESIVTTWLLMIIFIIIGFLIKRQLKIHPNTTQVIVEAIIDYMEQAIGQVLRRHYEAVLPFIMTIWVFLVVANLLGLIPGLHSPTRDLSVTAALAVLVFLSVHWFGIRTQGLKRYLMHYLTPSPILLPFHIISEITRTVAMAVRLFGNMMSLELVALLLLMVAGFLVPVPILMLHIVEALVQAYIFGMLALVYIVSSIQTMESVNTKLKENNRV